MLRPIFADTICKDQKEEEKETCATDKRIIMSSVETLNNDIKKKETIREKTKLLLDNRNIKNNHKEIYDLYHNNNIILNPDIKINTYPLTNRIEECRMFDYDSDKSIIWIPKINLKALKNGMFIKVEKSWKTAE
tara:strand:- start:1151 stop:1552 length:402 start_codon:yes stop_codon:yes gene_type:complete